MTHRLNTNKQFMIGNGILAFAIIIVVAIFIYISFKAFGKQEKNYAETYAITLVKGFAGDSISVYMNDSLLLNTRVAEEPLLMEINRFDEHTALMIVDNLTERVSLFQLSQKGGTVYLAKEEDGVKMLAN